MRQLSVICMLFALIVQVNIAESETSLDISNGRILDWITIKRNDINILDKDSKSGHYWIEILDGPNGKPVESYGWWPKSKANLIDALAGIPGELNGQTYHGGTPTNDPYQGKKADTEFHPLLMNTLNDQHVLDKIREFVRGYKGEWRWTLGWGQNCQTFQTALMDDVGLTEPSLRESPKPTISQGSENSILGKWEGMHEQYAYGIHETYPMIMEILTLKDNKFIGTLHWPTLHDSISTCEGYIEGDSLQWTEPRLIQGSNILLNGIYKAKLVDKNILIGNWYSPEDGVEGAKFELKHISKSIDSGNLDEDPSYVQSAEDWFNKGKALYAQSRYGEAVTAFDKAIEINPQYEMAWAVKADSLTAVGRPEEAIEAADRAIELDPQHANPWAYKACAFRQLGRYEEAVNAIERAVEIDPNYGGGWYDKGTYLKLLGRTTEANAAFAKAKELGYTG